MTKAKSQFACDPRVIRALRARQDYKLAPRELSSELFFTRHLPEFIGNMPRPTTTRAFVGYLSFFRGKVRVSRFTQKPFCSKNVLKPTLDMKQQVFPRDKLKNNNNNNNNNNNKTIHAANKWVKQD